MLNLITVFTNKAKEIDEHFSKPENGEGFDKAGRKILKWVAIIYATCKGVDVAIEWVNKKLGLNTEDNPYNNPLGPRFAPKGTPKTKSSTTALPTQQTPQGSNATVPEAPARNESSNDEEVICVDLAEVAENPDNRVVRLVGEWVKQEEVTLLCANRGAGKSTAAVQLALELATGGCSKLFGVELGPKQDCVYLSYEMSQAQWGERYQGAVEELRGRVKMAFPPTRTIDAALSHCGRLCDNYQKTGARHLTIIIDNLGRIVENSNNPSSKDIETLIDGLYELISKYRRMGMTVTFLVVVHTTKYGDTPRGSGVLENTTDATITITLRDEKDKVCDISHTRIRSGASPAPFAARLVSEPYLHFEPVDTPTSQPDSALAGGEVEGWQQLVEHAKYLTSDKGKDELDKLKAELGSEDLYANMPEEQKAELVALAKTLVNQSHSYRLTSAIILLEKGKYISHDAISKCCKG